MGLLGLDYGWGELKKNFLRKFMYKKRNKRSKTKDKKGESKIQMIIKIKAW